MPDDVRISIHALLAESDDERCEFSRNNGNFYPRSPCGERQQAKSLKIPPLCISIHALLAESDSSSWSATATSQRISIHALLAESDGFPRPLRAAKHQFLSTLSLRRATSRAVSHQTARKFLSTLSLRRATMSFCRSCSSNDISIHALLAESDRQAGQQQQHHNEFLSTLSLRRATVFPDP